MVKKSLYAKVFTIILISAFVFTLLDAIVFPKTYTVLDTSKNNSDIYADNNVASSTGVSASPSPSVSGSSANSPDNTTDSLPANTDPVITANSYKDENISITIEECNEDGIVFYVADIQISNIKYFRTAFANNTFGKNITQKTSVMAENNNAIFAINGDYYGFRDTGLIIRNGILYRDNARSSPDNKTLAVDKNGNFSIVTESEISGTELIESGIVQSFSFGPVLVENGNVADINTQSVSKRENPRTAIGQVSALHYIIIVADGRTDESNGMTLVRLAQEFAERGCTVAYNLDGGGSSAMWFNGEIINNPTDGKTSGERKISDIIYIA